jgi:hypothetical protein
MLRLGCLRCREADLVALLARWECTPLECHVVVRLLMLWAPSDIARERGCTLSHIRNAIHRIVRRSGSTAGVAGVLAIAGEALLPHDADASDLAVHDIASAVQAQRGT